jgi:hypothetical protein
MGTRARWGLHSLALCGLAIKQWLGVALLRRVTSALPPTTGLAPPSAGKSSILHRPSLRTRSLVDPDAKKLRSCYVSNLAGTDLALRSLVTAIAPWGPLVTASSRIRVRT